MTEGEMRASRALLTDLYQLTMAQAYWRSGLAQREAVFQQVFREHPFGGGFCIACGLAQAQHLLLGLRFEADDLAYLAGLKGSGGAPLFAQEFLEELGRMRLACDLDAMPEGTLAFAGEPLLRVRGPLWQCQLLETPLLNALNFPTLVATKAARICLAAGAKPVMEFGLRRAQGEDGGLTASRAAYVGGCAATSNLLAGKLHDIPVRGTHAHSWVMCFDSELEAFERYAQAVPEGCVFLVDTYDTLEGVRRAVQAGLSLRARGHEMLGIRLDSGDLLELSRAARRILDEAGFPEASIVASGDLDEEGILELDREGAPITAWGVGTRLATAWDQPALGGVYKLTALRGEDGAWQRKLKLSDEPAKTSDPGILQVRRFMRQERFVADVIFDLELGPPDPGPEGATAFEDLLVPVLRAGKQVLEPPSASVARARAREQLERLDPEVRRLFQPKTYRVHHEARLAREKQRLVEKLGGRGPARGE